MKKALLGVATAATLMLPVTIGLLASMPVARADASSSATNIGGERCPIASNLSELLSSAGPHDDFKVHLQITVDGRVSDLKILQSTGIDALDKAFTQHYATCHFTPTQKNGVATEHSATLVWQSPNKTGRAVPARAASYSAENSKPPATGRDQVYIDESIPCQLPQYPADAKEAHAEGTTKISVHVSKEGNVLDSKLVESSGNASLDQASISTLSQCHYKPVRADGQPGEVWAPIKYTWKLQ